MLKSDVLAKLIVCILSGLLITSILFNVLVYNRNQHTTQSIIRAQLELTITHLNVVAPVLNSMKNGQMVSVSDLAGASATIYNAADEINAIGHWQVFSGWQGYANLVAQLALISAEVGNYRNENTQLITTNADTITYIVTTLTPIVEMNDQNFGDIRSAIDLINHKIGYVYKR
jgi:hypothetical protein